MNERTRYDARPRYRRPAIVGHQIRYNLENGFPPHNRTGFGKNTPGALGEHIGFLNGARTLEELKKYGMPAIFWDRWVTKEKCADFRLPEGDAGDGSYQTRGEASPQKRVCHSIKLLTSLQQIQERPYPTNHYYRHGYRSACFSTKEIRARLSSPPVMDGFTSSPTLTQKSLSFIIFSAVPTYQLASCRISSSTRFAFGMMLAQVIGYTMKERCTFSDAHIYHNHLIR